MQYKSATGIDYVSAATPLPVTLSGTIPATITDDTTTNATMYLVWVTAATGNLPLKVTSTKLTYNPSTGAFATGGNVSATRDTNGAVSFVATNANAGASAQARFLAVADGGNCQLKAMGTGNTTYGAADCGVINCDTMSGGFRIAHNDVVFFVLGSDGVTTLSSTVATPAGGSVTARTLMGTTAGFGIYYGSGAPSVSAAQGSIYLRSDGSSTSTRLYVNSDGGTTWVNFTSAS